MTPSGVAAIHPFRVYTVLYSLLWCTGLVVTFAAILYPAQPGQLGISSTSALFVLATTSVLLLGLIYMDMHNIERLQSSDRDYPSFVGVCTKDAVLRSLIVVCLVFTVGELRDLQGVFWWMAHHPMIVGRLKGIPWCRSIGQFLFRSDVFASGSCMAFFFIVCWNTTACYYRGRTYRSRVSLFTGLDMLVQEWLLWLRNGLFIVTAVICTVYWGFVWIVTRPSGRFADLFVVLYALFVGVVTVLRLPPTRRRMESILSARCEEACRIGLLSGFVPPGVASGLSTGAVGSTNPNSGASTTLHPPAPASGGTTNP